MYLHKCKCTVGMQRTNTRATPWPCGAHALIATNSSSRSSFCAMYPRNRSDPTNVRRGSCQRRYGRRRGRTAAGLKSLTWRAQLSAGDFDKCKAYRHSDRLHCLSQGSTGNISIARSTRAFIRLIVSSHGSSGSRRQPTIERSILRWHDQSKFC